MPTEPESYEFDDYVLTPERVETTLHEGDVGYRRRWNFWYRINGRVLQNPDIFYHGYGTESIATEVLRSELNASAKTDNWSIAQSVWKWAGFRTKKDPVKLGKLVESKRRWPSGTEYAQFWYSENYIPYSACFSSAHLLAHLLLIAGVSPWAVAIVSAHHTYNGAPPTASHVYVALYAIDGWVYLDLVNKAKTPVLSGSPVSAGEIPTVDYIHPFEAIPPPDSCLDVVPLL